MSEELKNNEKCCNCNCEEILKKLAITCTGSFIGCLLALCVFSALTRPMLPPPPCAQIANRIPPASATFDRPQRHHHKMGKKEFKHHKFDKKREFNKEGKRPDKWEKRPDRPDRGDRPQKPQRPDRPDKGNQIKQS